MKSVYSKCLVSVLTSCALGPSPVRLVDDIGPVKGASNPDLNCGLSAQLAEMVVPASPGSNVTLQWSGGQGNLVSNRHFPDRAHIGFPVLFEIELMMVILL